MAFKVNSTALITLSEIEVVSTMFPIGKLYCNKTDTLRTTDLKFLKILWSKTSNRTMLSTARKEKVELEVKTHTEVVHIHTCTHTTRVYINGLL